MMDCRVGKGPAVHPGHTSTTAPMVDCEVEKGAAMLGAAETDSSVDGASRSWGRFPSFSPKSLTARPPSLGPFRTPPSLLLPTAASPPAGPLDPCPRVLLLLASGIEDMDDDASLSAPASSC